MSGKLRSGEKLVVASHNPGKVREIRALLEPYGVEAVSAADLGLAEPEENGKSFAANAELKARAAAEASGLPALADDSGLEVDALGGAPGVYSARWAGEDKNFGFAMLRVENALQQEGAVTPGTRRANFTCALSLAWPGGECDTFEGRVYGTLVSPPRGRKGFGYDPMFLPFGETETFGQMEPDAKHAISHRAKAFEQFVAACLERD
jgi:XTP/dITP diphosphohydrolase